MATLETSLLSDTRRWLWRALAVLCVALGLIGVLLPVLRTVPFILAAAWAAGKG